MENTNYNIIYLINKVRNNDINIINIITTQNTTKIHFIIFLKTIASPGEYLLHNASAINISAIVDNIFILITPVRGIIASFHYSINTKISCFLTIF